MLAFPDSLDVARSGAFAGVPDCAHCGGSGEVCSVCWNVGWDGDNGHPSIDWIAPCPKCARRNARCFKCRGNGRLEMLEHCPDCDGSGLAFKEEN